MSVMTYKSFAARIEFDADDEVFVGHIAGINDVVGFHSDTVEGLKVAFHGAVDDYVATCAKVGKAPERPYSGKLMMRVRPEVHARVALAAQLSGKSMNEWGEEALAAAAKAVAG